MSREPASREVSAMDMPRPGAAHAALSRLVGTWAGDEVLHPNAWDPETRSAQGRFVIRLACGGFFLHSEYSETRDGAPLYTGIGIYGYDVERQRYTMHWFDSMGGSYEQPALGTFEGPRLRFENQGPRGHARYTYVIEGDDTFTFAIETSPDGAAWTPFMEGRYDRSPDA